MLPKTPNPLLEDAGPPEADLINLARPTLVKRRKSAKRQMLDLRRKQSAAEVVAQLDQEHELYGFTKGQFSIIDLIAAALDKTGPAHAAFSTWTAAKADVQIVLQFLEKDQLLSSRWLVDLSLQRRQPELANTIRQLFGADAIRVARNHAKFYLLGNDTWKLVIRTSMNLNFNPRFEDFTIAHDPSLFDFLTGMLDHIWQTQDAKLAHATPHAIHQQWLKL